MILKVYTTGVYDTFHKGHYQFLLKASKYGDLIVGVTSDFLVKKEKHKVPIVNELDRIKTLKCLDLLKKLYYIPKVIKLKFIE